jgi:hypothetical protein
MTNLGLINLILAILALAASGIAVFFVMKLQKLRSEFFAGKQAASLEDLIINQNKKINELREQNTFIEQNIKELQATQKLAIQKVGIVRYNPFQNDGGNLSFSMALLDQHNNGIVVTSMHGREANRTYAKPIKNSKSEFELTIEEKQAIENAGTLKN